MKISTNSLLNDFGISWKKVNGESISLPMRAGNMDIIDGYLNAAMGEYASILIDYKNQPAVIYAIDGKTFYRYLAGSVWQPRIELDI